jgi:hypothetical protein
MQRKTYNGRSLGSLQLEMRQSSGPQRAFEGPYQGLPPSTIHFPMLSKRLALPQDLSSFSSSLLAHVP